MPRKEARQPQIDTPSAGPWRVEIGSESKTVYIVARDGAVVCNQVGQVTAKRDPRLMADARLLAAAPDLLLALGWLRRVMLFPKVRANSHAADEQRQQRGLALAAAEAALAGALAEAARALGRAT